MPVNKQEILDEFAQLHYYYEIENEKKVICFIENNIFLLGLLVEAPIHIYRIFGKEVKLHLKLCHDAEEGWDELFIVIKSSYAPVRAVELENELAEEWFIDRMEIANGKLNFAEEPL